MNHWLWVVSVPGIVSTAVIFGTDVFFLTVGRSALRHASESAVTEVMGFLHMYADARMPVWGVLAIVSNLLLFALSKGVHRWFHLAALLALVVFVAVYNRFSKPINRIQTRAAKSGQDLSNARELQELWDKSLWIRVPLLTIALVVQCLVW